MNWPLSHEFNEAVQNPGYAFDDPDLQSATAVVGARGLPLPRSGNFADVYQLRGVDGREWAVKCFTRPVTGLDHRYAAIAKALSSAGLPFTIDFTYLARGIRISGTWRPVVKMEWVEGLLLHQVVRENTGRPATLAVLGQMWVKLCRRLRECGVAHADLQHGNVVMAPGSRPGAYVLKLIDYDGMYVPALANLPSGESGHPAYQHPQRTGPGGYSPAADRFPHLVIGTALKALQICGQQLWDRYDTGDNLLFVESDLKKPADSRLLRELWQTDNPEIQALAGRLAIASQRPMPQTPWLDEIAPEGEPIPLDDEARQEAVRTLGLAGPVSVPSVPEPPPEPVQWDHDVEQPPAIVAPSTLPAGSVHRPFPNAKLPSFAREESAAERTEKNAHRKKLSRKPKEQKSKNGLILAVVIGGGLLLVSGVAVGIAVSGKARPPQQETAEIKPDQVEPAKQTLPKAPATVPGNIVAKPSATNPNDRAPTPSVAVSPQKEPRSLPAQSGVPSSIKEAIRIPLGKDPRSDVRFTSDGQSLLIVGQPQTLMTYDLRTGSARRLPDAPRGDGKSAIHLFTLNNRLALWRTGEQSVSTLDLRSGQPSSTIAVPNLPVTPGAFGAAIAISPDGRYVALGRQSPLTSPTFNKERVYLPVPFQVLDATTRKTVLSFDWTSGAAHFSADSSRILVIEGSGRGRWFKLPSAEPDGEWQYAEQLAGMHLMQVESVSHDGQRVLCFGTARGQGMTQFVLDGSSGRLVSVFGLDFHNTSGRLSADGRVAALLRHQVSPASEIWMMLFDVSRGVETARIKVTDQSSFIPAFALAADGLKAAAVIRAPNGDAIVYDLINTGSPSADGPK